MARQHQTALVLMLLLLLPLTVSISAAAEDEQPAWRNVGLDPAEWTDRPETEDSPMMASYTGNAVIQMEVSYREGHTSSRTEGIVLIELFEQWAPITTDNMIAHVESGLYDGIFFHRVIDDFVAQSGDPTCRAIGAYPLTSPGCGSGGTGETIPLEHNDNLSHVDGALGMARSADPDSADSQWYIAETEAHGLDPENRDDEGYATFGVVRHGMSHIRSIALTPTTDDPSGAEEIQNPASSAGRPVYEAQVVSMQMIGVADPDGTIRNPVSQAQSENSWLQDAVLVVGMPLLVVLFGVGITLVVYNRQENNPLNEGQHDDTVLEGEMLMVAELIEPESEIKDES